MLNPKDAVWTEKYRPKLVSEMVGSFKLKVLEHLKNPKSIPNFLLHSKVPGTGKTTLMKAIVRELGCDYLLLNSSDERGIDTVREKIKEFSMTMSSKPELKRAVLLDEADGLTKDAQDALRNIMEIYASNVFFILTANNINKIIDPIQGRCELISFAYPDKDETYVYLKRICDMEMLSYTEAGIKTLIDKKYPSIRNCVKTLQELKALNKNVIPENIVGEHDLFGSLYEEILSKNIDNVRKLVFESSLDPRELNQYIWYRSVEKTDLKMIQLCARNERDIALGANAVIIFISSCWEMIK